MNSLFNDFTIIIPCQCVTPFLDICIKECLNNFAGVEIFILVDKLGFKGSEYPSSVKIIFSDNYKMSYKRNMAARLTDREFIAFIDSDAYPHYKWLHNSRKLLVENNDIAIVGGPTLPVSRGKYLRDVAVGNALHSFLVSGPDLTRRKASAERISLKLSSCNMVLRRKCFLKTGGLDENLYIGEDREFCQRLSSQGYKILYSPTVAVYHFNPSLKGFFCQRLSWGLSESDIRRAIKRFDLDSFCYIASALMIILFLTATLAVGASLLNVRTYISVIIICLVIAFFETLRVSRDLKAFPLTLIAICGGCLLPGIGLLITWLRIPVNIRKIYTRKN